MSTDLQLERICERIELVGGPGSRRRGRLCIMSFAALLAGEAHGDRPRAVSPLMRSFAIPLNDGMDAQARQRLKPFAPRLVGTADGRDGERVRLLYDAIFGELLLEALKDKLGRSRTDGRSSRSWHAMMPDPSVAMLAHAPALARLWSLVNHDVGLFLCLRRIQTAYESGRFHAMASTAAAWVVGLAEAAPSPERRELYWSKAIDLLDRMCDVGAEERPAAIPPERLEATLAIVGTKPVRRASPAWQALENLAGRFGA